MSQAMSHIQKLTSSVRTAEEETSIQHDYQIESKPVNWEQDNVQDNYTFVSELARLLKI